MLINFIIFLSKIVYIPRGHTTSSYVSFISFVTVLTMIDFSILSIFLLIFLFATFDYFFFNDSENIDFLTMILFLNFGAVIVLTSKDFINMLLSLELITLGSYVLVGFYRHNRLSVQNGIKYLILGSIPTLLLILGITSFYKLTGTFSFEFLTWTFRM